MPRIEFPNFCGPHEDLGLSPLTNTSGTSPLDAAICQNLYPHTADVGGRQRRFLIGRPGMGTTFTTLAQTPVRALASGQNQVPSSGPVLFAVGGTHFYSINGVGIATDLGAIPSSSGVAPIRIVFNGASSSLAPGNRTAVLMDYTSGSALFGPGTINYYNGTNVVLAFNANDLEYLDGFMVAIAAGASLQTSNPNQINVSAFGDHTNWTPGPSSTQAFAIRTGSSDQLNALAVLNGFLWVFGQRTTELWYNAGLSPFPFQRYQGATLNFGCMSTFSVVKFWDRIIWLAQDHTGFPQVLMSEGMGAKRISNSTISAMLASQETGSAGSLSLAWAYGYQEAGHTFYVLQLFNGSSFPSFPAMVYDIEENVWHTRKWAGAQPCVSATIFQENVVGMTNSGQITPQLLSSGQDLTTGGAAQTIAYLRQAPYISDLNAVTKHAMFEIIGDFGTNQPSLSYSDDWGNSYRSTFNLTAPGSDQGFFTPGNLKRYYARQLGRSRARIYQFSLTSSGNPVRIAGAYLELGGGIGE